MKIGIESSVLARRQKTGVDYYAESLIAETIKSMPNSHFDLCYLSFFTRKSVPLLKAAPNITERRISFMPGKFYNLFEHYFIGIPFDLLAGVKEDIFFFPNFARWPLVFTKKSVVIVYDLGFLESPETIIARHRRYLTKAVPRSISKATSVLTISQSTKQQIIDHYGTDASKIVVAEPAIDHDFYVPAPANKIIEVKQRYGIAGEYILFLGTIEPRKNLAGLLRAYSLLPDDLQKKYQLVLAGGKGWLDEEIDALAAKIKPGRLVRTGYFDQALKPALYSGASVFVYPSFYEGWGMQIAEAMACGTPVITADNSSLPEAGGDAALYIKADDTKALAQSIQRVLTSPKLAADMIKKGRQHAASFSWANGAKILKQTLEKLAHTDG
jgi:glycosyltransferase involved in cell wall biosynthesis